MYIMCIKINYDGSVTFYGQFYIVAYKVSKTLIQEKDTEKACYCGALWLREVIWFNSVYI